MVITPGGPHEGESERSMLPTSGDNSDSLKWKWSEEEEKQELRCTRGICVDYQYLHNPFPDEDEDANEATFSSEEIFTIIAGDELKSLKEAKSSTDWPEWDSAIQTGLAQLQQMGTWRLVEKPPDAIPIANKWVFIKKRNKTGEIVKHKARLVAKGCAQQPGHDYVKTFSPVIQMDTIWAILALAPIKGLKIQQMDVKGAYLNGMLKKKVYMHQPKGYKDSSGWVCELIKTLYGLKQSGQERNKELDGKLKKFGFQHLHSDPCAYIKRDGNNVFIITVWVDDLLLFASSNKLMQQTKTDLCTKWEVTDLGEPTKIIGIEITQTEDSITIS